MRIVIALGGNALLKRGQTLTAENQRANMAAAAAGLALVCREHEVALVHGNGPQVGLLALEADLYKAVPPYPLDVLGAESQGMIGYVIAQELRAALPERQIAVILTQTRVDADDPALRNPTKPIGPVYSLTEAEGLRAGRNWQFAADGAGLRRVVGSPEPVEIIDLPVISHLVTDGVLTICGGGGGIPVARTNDSEQPGRLVGIEGVIDKDLTAALLASRLGAQQLVILTDVDGVFADWGQPGQALIRSIQVEDLKAMSFPAGSMGPKVEAACRFVSATGYPAFIGNLAAAVQVVEGRTGTQIVR